MISVVFQLFLILLISSCIHTVSSSSRETRGNFIRSQYRQTELQLSPSSIMDHFHDLLGPSLCFTEKSTFALIQLCLQHGFRRLELERFASHVVSQRIQVPFSETTPFDEAEPQMKLEDKKEIGIEVVEEKITKQTKQENRYVSFWKYWFPSSSKKNVESHSVNNDNNQKGATSKASKHFPPLKSGKIYSKPMSGFLQKELEDFFNAAASESPEALDSAFSLHSKKNNNDRTSPTFYFNRANLASPFRSDDYAFTERRQNPVTALANITSEVYGRFDPQRSKMRFVRPGEVEIVYPNGDPCYHFIDSPAMSMQWTTYLRFVCSFHAVGRMAKSAVHLNDHVEGDEDEEILSRDPTRWDVRVNAEQCMVNVFVFTDAVC